MNRRRFLQTSLGVAGLSLPDLLGLRKLQAAQGTGVGRAKSCIVLFCWGGISQLDSWDPKPDAPKEIRGQFKPISTATPGIQVSEHMPKLARHTEKLAIVRSVHHKQGGHQQGMYINMTGHNPEGGIKAKSRNNWPSLASMMASMFLKSSSFLIVEMTLM